MNPMKFMLEGFVSGGYHGPAEYGGALLNPEISINYCYDLWAATTG